MAIDITFSLEDSDLEYFRDVMKQAKSSSTTLSEEEILNKVRNSSQSLKSSVPSFVLSRLAQLDTLVAMVEDVQWQIPDEERADVMSALAYFSEPEDLIPDHIPALGYLDDAIMIELVVEDLKGDIDAFVEFCEYREREKVRIDPATITTDDWLDAKRRELHSKMRNRRSSRRSSGRGFRIF